MSIYRPESVSGRKRQGGAEAPSRDPLADPLLFGGSSPQRQKKDAPAWFKDGFADTNELVDAPTQPQADPSVPLSPSKWTKVARSVNKRGSFFIGRDKPSPTAAAAAGPAFDECDDSPRLADTPPLHRVERHESKTQTISSSPVYDRGHSHFYDEMRDFGHWMRLKGFEMGNRPETPKGRFMAKCEELGIIPEPLLARVAKEGEREGEFCIPGFAVGNNIMVALADSVGTMDLTLLDVTDNRASDASLRILLKELHQNQKEGSNTLQELRLSKNRLGRQSFQNLSSLLKVKGSSLVKLSLEETGVNDPAMVVIAQALQSSKQTLSHLNLAKNQIGDAGAGSMARALSVNQKLRQLDMSWNNIGWRGGLALARGLSKSRLSHLDLSWNSMGSNMDRGRECSSALSVALEVNMELLHASFSHNNFSTLDCESIAKGLRANHSLMGLHMEGDAVLDARGFLSTMESGAQDWDGGGSHVFTRILRPRVRGREAWNPVSNCWICEKWVECRFAWHHAESPPDPLDQDAPTLPAKPTDVYLMADFDKWEPQKMNVNKDEPNEHECYRMVPPGPVHYYFMIDGQASYAANIETVDRGPLGYTHLASIKMGKGLPHPDLPALNTFDALESDQDISLQPRLVHAESPKRKPVTGPWRFESSVFYKYKQDTDALLDKAFEKDFAQTKIPTSGPLKKDPEEAERVREVLQRNYAVFKDVFKHYSAAFSSEVFNMAGNAFNEVLNVCEITEDVAKGCNRTEADMVFISSNMSGPKNQQLNPKRALCRFQFLELMTSLAITKFFRLPTDEEKRCASPSEAVERFVAECLSKGERDAGQEFRWNEFYNEEIDDLFKSKQTELNKVYSKVCGYAHG
mmetsp:Transcript_6210/g.15516  ORF Transcript_6210/g.15516 Transcript_6210/m.15516 type:complete len:861 (+) Transcript_6210:1384-3966(+)